MKWGLFLLLAAFSTTGFAVRITARSSWEQIEASRRHNVVKPYELNAVGGVFNACLDADGETLRSIQDVRYCVQGHEEQMGGMGDSGWTHWVCDRYASAPASMPRTSTRRECVEYSNEADNVFCVKFENKRFVIPLEYSLEVQEMGGEEGFRTAFHKRHTIGPCQN